MIDILFGMAFYFHKTDFTVKLLYNIITRIYLIFLTIVNRINEAKIEIKFTVIYTSLALISSFKSDREKTIEMEKKLFMSIYDFEEKKMYSLSHGHVLHTVIEETGDIKTTRYN